MRIACLMLMVLIAPNAIRGDDESDRYRRARAALAVAWSAPAVATAPAPRQKPLTFGDGYTAAKVGQTPLVLFVGCRGHAVSGAEVSRVDRLGDVEGPAVMVAYPVGETMYVHKVLPYPVAAADLTIAVRGASAKIGTSSKDTAVPKPLNWDH